MKAETDREIALVTHAVNDIDIELKADRRMMREVRDLLDDALAACVNGDHNVTQEFIDRCLVRIDRALVRA